MGITVSNPLLGNDSACFNNGRARIAPLTAPCQLRVPKGAVASAASLPKEFKPAYNNPEREISTRKCDNEDGCVAFTGQIWAAVGLGACSPETWTSWDSKWWGDDGCWTFGALGALSYLDYPEPGKPEWALDYILAAE